MVQRVTKAILLISITLLITWGLTGAAAATNLTDDAPTDDLIDGHQKISESVNHSTESQNVEISLKEPSSSTHHQAGYMSQDPAITANVNLSLENGSKYKFVIHDEDTGGQATYTLPENLTVPAGSQIIFPGYSTPEVENMYWIPGHSDGVSRGHLETSGTFDLYGMENLSVTLIDAETGEAISSTSTKPHLFGFDESKDLTQDSTSGTIQISMDRSVLPKDSTLSARISPNDVYYHEAEDKLEIDMYYDESQNKFKGEFDSDKLEGGNYSVRILGQLNPYETKFDVAYDDEQAITVNNDGSSSGISVDLVPSDKQMGVNQTATVDVKANDVSNGVASYGFEISVSNASTASITDIELKGTSEDDTLTEVKFAEDGSNVTVAAGNAGHDNGVLAAVTLEGNAPGTTSLTLSNVAVGDQDANSYEIQSVTNATVSVTETKAPAVVGGTPATDPNGDGTYEDVNGDGQSDIVDVSAMFQNYQKQTVQNNAAQFDFNGDGGVNIVDVNALFQAVV